MRAERVLILLSFSLLAYAEVKGIEGWSPVNSLFEWSFPEDHWAQRGYRTEWWYLTGHLTSVGEPQRRFGYQFTFFRIGVTPNQLNLDSDWSSGHMIMGHAAISDLDKEKHWFSEVLHRESPVLGGFPEYPDSLIAWSRAPAGTNGKWWLKWNGEAFDFYAIDQRQKLSLQLTTSPLKPRVFQGPGGVSPKSKNPDFASLYYSFTRLRTQGTLEIEGEKFAVAGQSWMDKEFSSSILSGSQVGWDWFSLQMEDGTEFMCFQLRNDQGVPDFSWATRVSVEGTPSYLDAELWSLQRLDWWRSPTGALYPSRWSIRFQDSAETLQIVPVFEDQENRSLLIPDLVYWEGAVEVLDPGSNLLGKGFVELTGYLEGGRLPL